MNEKKREKEVKQEVAVVADNVQPEVVASAEIIDARTTKEAAQLPRHKALASLIKAERCGGKELDHLIRQVSAKLLNGENVRDSLVILHDALGELHSNADAEAREHIGAAIAALS